MSNALAIAGVTAVLRDLLNEGLINHDITATVGHVNVTCDPPDSIKPLESGFTSRLNLFMYRVTPNPGWRNEALPSRSADGQRLSNPPLALDLHYLLTSYGKEPFHTDILLGYGAQLMHENPVLPRDRIRQSLGGVPPVNGGSVLPSTFPALAAADLADQYEQIRITPDYMNTEEMSKLWTAMQANYRPTVAYIVTVVLIQSRRPVQSAIRVRTRNIAVRGLNRPHIDSVSPQAVAPGGSLRISGYNLRGDITRVRIGSSEVTPTDSGDASIDVTVPSSQRAGVTTVQVLHPIDFGTEIEPHRGFESNTAAFMLLPVISGLASSVARGGTLTVNENPPVEQDQKVTLILGDRGLELPARAPGSPPLAALSFTIPNDFPVGTYLVRLRVDGAESTLELESDAVEPDPLKKEYLGPKVTVT